MLDVSSELSLLTSTSRTGFSDSVTADLILMTCEAPHTKFSAERESTTNCRGRGSSIFTDTKH